MSKNANPKISGILGEDDLEKVVSSVTKAIDAANGLIAPAAKALGLDRDVLEKMIAEIPDLAAAVMVQRKAWVDLAFAKLLQAINAGQPWAIKYMLDMAAKDAAIKNEGGKDERSMR